MRILISKSEKILEIRDGERILHRFPIGIGRRETGHKETEGDERTPEGDYRVCVKNPKSRYYLSLGIDYPNILDAEAGLAAGIITAEERDAIVRSHEAGKIPPWDTALGGQIYLHGDLEKQAWSAGCVRLNNPDMKTLYDLCAVGTPVRIR